MINKCPICDEKLLYTGRHFECCTVFNVKDHVYKIRLTANNSIGSETLCFDKHQIILNFSTNCLYIFSNRNPDQSMRLIYELRMENKLFPKITSEQDIENFLLMD